MQSLTLFRN